ncbi:helix-turn-helix transcriptional regulator [Latilactobacillus sakei]|uniref:helix-turn-helix transcriptional regulator n=1 Tax=Latilactobacillus sakei TaxID=1599 RepID=UPI003F53069B
MNSAYRQLTIFQRLTSQQTLIKADLAQEFGVDPRAIQRDMSQIKQFMADQQLAEHLTFSRKLGGYRLSTDQDVLSNQTILVLIKVLLASRSLNKSELNRSINGLLSLIKINDRQKIEPLIKNEIFHYIPLQHQKNILNSIWQFSQFITKKQTLTIQYQRQHGEIVERTILPEAIIFSEYYFYVISYNTRYQNSLFYRLDRIQDWHPADAQIQRSYAQRFEEGELRKTIQYMQPGKRITLQFEFTGIVEAALDRFPTAKIKTRSPKKGSVLIEAEAFDKGAMMWLLSQGAMVKVVAPQSFVDLYKAEIRKMNAWYLE